MPTEQDIVHSHTRTTGISETVFSLHNHDIVMVDVGGQKSERRKWVHCFENVTCVLFVASLSGYDQLLVEDKHTVGHVVPRPPFCIRTHIDQIHYSSRQNQMRDAMTVWESICDARWFQKTPIVSARL